MTTRRATPDDGSRVLSLRLDDELAERLQAYAARRGMTVQDYVVRILAREDFDERCRTAAQASARLAEWGRERGRRPADGAVGGPA